MINIETIYKLTTHNIFKQKSRRYPSYKLWTGASAYFHTVKEAELFLQPLHDIDTYCYSLSELPMGMDHYDRHSFSERIYLPNKQLWSVRNYADIFPVSIPSPYSEIEFDNYIYGRCFFDGRSPEEIHFKQGDIIEIFCYSGNNFWSAGSMELAIVVDVPPTKEEMATRIERFLKESQYLTGDRGFDLGIEFNGKEDAYTVIPAYITKDTETEILTDHCPTHCAMIPSYGKETARYAGTVFGNRTSSKVAEQLIKSFPRRYARSVAK